MANKLKTICEHDTDRNIGRLNKQDVLKLIGITPTTYIKYGEGDIADKEFIFNGRYVKFDKWYELTKHQIENADCEILHELDKTDMENVQM